MVYTAVHNIPKPDGSGFHAPGESFDGEGFSKESLDYLQTGGHIMSADGVPFSKEAQKVDTAESERLETEVRGLKIKVGKLESHAKKVNAYAATLKGDDRKAFDEAMKAKAEEKPDDKPDDPKD